LQALISTSGPVGLRMWRSGAGLPNNLIEERYVFDFVDSRLKCRVGKHRQDRVHLSVL
jgi:hypothetical protein